MRCAHCHGKTEVTDTRNYRNSIKRKRVCRNCKAVEYTYENSYDLSKALGELTAQISTHVKRTKALEGELYALVQTLAGVMGTLEEGNPIRGKAKAFHAVAAVRQKRPWSDDDLAKLDELYPKLGARVTAIRLNRSLSATRAQAHVRNLKLNPNAAYIRASLEGNHDG